MSNSPRDRGLPTPPITDALILWMESLVAPPVWKFLPGKSVETQAMEMQYQAGRYSILEELRTLKTLQKGQ